jgi:hypothetical protein
MATCIHRLLLAALTALAAVACDPGWQYQAPGGTAVHEGGLRYDVPGPPGLAVRVRASALAGSLDVEVTLRNLGVKLLAIASPRLEAADARGVSLPEVAPPKLSCPANLAIMQVPPGVSCTISASFAIRPLVRGFIFMQDNPDLARVTVKVVSNQPQVVPDFTIPLVWQK